MSFRKLILIFIFTGQGCLDLETKKDHGLSYNVRSEVGLMSPGERSIKLEFEKNIGDTSEITALITAPNSFEGLLKYNWKLGAGLTIKDSALEGSIVVTASQKVHKVKILVKEFNSEKIKHVKFEVYSEAAGKKIFADALISSQADQSFEQIVKDVENYKKENN